MPALKNAIATRSRELEVEEAETTQQEAAIAAEVEKRVQAALAAQGNTAEQLEDIRIAINTESEEALKAVKLPQIGERSLAKILSARDTGPFLNLEDMLDRAEITHVNTKEEKAALNALIRFD